MNFLAVFECPWSKETTAQNSKYKHMMDMVWPNLTSLH